MVLDEAHLSIPLMKLLESIRAIQHDGWRPRFEVLTMSATPASGESAAFTDDDLEHDGFRRRLQAGKRCSPHCVESAEGKRGGKKAVRSRIIDLATRHEAGSILIFVREVDAATTLYKELASHRQTLEEHGEAVGRACEKLAERVGLSPAMIATLREAGAWHDRGKGRVVWQRAAGAWPSETPMAKSKSGTAFRPKLLGGYRHEFSSVADAEDVERGLALPVRTPEDDPDAALLHTLALHLIAAHHGHARPGFPRPEQWDAALPDAEAERIAREVEVRFAACHEHIGPWALAWLESLVKAADARVSAGQPVDAA